MITTFKTKRKGENAFKFSEEKMKDLQNCLRLILLYPPSKWRCERERSLATSQMSSLGKSFHVPGATLPSSSRAQGVSGPSLASITVQGMNEGAVLHRGLSSLLQIFPVSLNHKDNIFLSVAHIISSIFAQAYNISEEGSFIILENSNWQRNVFYSQTAALLQSRDLCKRKLVSYYGQGMTTIFGQEPKMFAFESKTKF